MKSNNCSCINNLACLVLFLLFSQISIAQDSQINENQYNEPNFWSQVYFGGGLGVSFGSNYFSGTISPSAVYRFNPQFSLGLGLNFTYNSEKNYYESTIVGTSIQSFFNIIPEIQLSAEYEQLYVNRNWDERTSPYLDESYWYPGLYLGVGFQTGNVTMGVRFDVLYVENKSIYANPYNPFVRFYF